MAKLSCKAKLEIDPFKNESVFIANNPIAINKYSIYLNEEIGKAEHYRELFDVLRDGETTDICLVYLNNFGGYVHTGIDIINSMKACRGIVYSVVTGPIYSMAPLIALSNHQLHIEPNVFMMFHDYSGATFGKGNEQKSAIDNDKPFFDNLFRETTKDFLTKDEIKKVINGKDLYLNRDNIIKRLKRLGRLFDVGKFGK